MILEFGAQSTDKLKDVDMQQFIDIAEAIIYALSEPKRVNVSSILVYIDKL